MNKKHGFSYLEIIIGIAVFSIVIHAFFTLITAAYQYVGLSRSQSTARALANQQMEIIRNLSYDKIGTIGGIPNGPIKQTQDRSINGQTYTLHTSIIYIDDPFDHTSPTDLLPTDYKRVRVRATWKGPYTTDTGITLLSNIVPKGVETMVGGGTLAILVFDAQGQPVPQADITIKAPTANPPIDLNLFTDNNGNLIMPGSPICTACYQITVTKEGYSSDSTIGTSDVTNPITPHQTILENQVTQVSFSIDKTSQIEFATNSYPLDSPLANTQVEITGQKTLGTDGSNKPVYKYDKLVTTDSNGKLGLNLEWDTYKISLPSGHMLSGSNPAFPVLILPNQPQSVKISVTNSVPYSLTALVKNASGSAIASAEAKLKNLSGYEASKFTGSEADSYFGFSFFQAPQSGAYTLEISHPNYQTATSSVTINDNIQQTIILNDN